MSLVRVLSLVRYTVSALMHLHLEAKEGLGKFTN